MEMSSSYGQMTRAIEDPVRISGLPLYKTSKYWYKYGNGGQERRNIYGQR